MKRWLARGLWLSICCSDLASADCWQEAGQRHGLEPALLYAIAEVESELKSGRVNRNRNGTRDVGLMQINSTHLPRLKKQGITEKRLLNEPCLSVQVGASILADFVARYGYNWTAVGAYNAGTAPSRQAARLRYAQKVWARYAQVHDDARFTVSEQ